jgi:hypothetical protein
MRIQETVADECSLTWDIFIEDFASGLVFQLASGTAAPSAAVSVATPGFGDGVYEATLAASDMCGRLTQITRRFTIDSTPPVARIDSPAPCACLCPGMTYLITGAALDLHLKTWVLEYFSLANNTWQSIGSGTGSVGSPTQPGLLVNWTVPTTAVQCCTLFRLTVSDMTDPDPCTGKNLGCNTVQVWRPVRLQNCADFNTSGDTSVQDLFSFLQAYFAACP